MNKTKIDWCTHTLNPVVGCTYGCPFCYARKMNARFKWIPKWEEPQFFPERLKMLESKMPKIIFMDSMSDIADWKEEWIHEVFKACADNPQHKYLFLTKRFDSFLDGFNEFRYSRNNIYIGASMCRQSDMEIKYHPDFLSIEPILEPIIALRSTFNLNWVIIGAETGNRKEKIIPKREWIQDIVNQCRAHDIPVFMKSSLSAIWGAELIQEYPWEEKS